MENKTSIARVIAKGVYYLLAGLLIFYTGSLTVDVGFIVFPHDPYLPFFLLALFDGGALSWLMMFLKAARGTYQRAVAITGFVLDVAGTFCVAAAGMYFSGQELVSIPAWMGRAVLIGVIAYTAINVLLVYLYHLADPDELAEIKMQSMQDELNNAAWSQVEAQLNEQAVPLAGIIKEQLWSGAMARMGLSLPEHSGRVIEGTAKDAPPVATFASEAHTPPADVASSGTDVNPTRAGKRKS